MSRKDIEARLDRSLENQIKAPQMERRFHAAVWARIEAVESRATNPSSASVAVLDELAATPRGNATRWLAISNGIGATVVVALLVYFGFKMFTGVDVSVEVPANVQVPQIPQAMVDQIVGVLGYVLGLATLVYGIGLTSLGRRVRASFS